jgi:hypothetical protein
MRGTVARELRKMAKAVSTKPWFDGYVEAKGATLNKEKSFRLGLLGKQRSHNPMMLKEATGRDIYKEFKKTFYAIGLPTMSGMVR